MVALAGLSEAVAGAEQPPEVAGEPIRGTPVTLVHRDLSAPLPVMAARRRAKVPQPRSPTARALSVLRPPDLATRSRAAEPGGDALLEMQAARRPTPSAASTPAPLVNFEGLSAAVSAPLAGGLFAPPDTVGAAGPVYFVQMINKIFAVYDKDGSECGGVGCVPAEGGAVQHQ